MRSINISLILTKQIKRKDEHKIVTIQKGMVYSLFMQSDIRLDKTTLQNKINKYIKCSIMSHDMN